MKEETGIIMDLIDIVPDTLISEYKRENICSIQYYVGIMKIPYYNKFNPVDPEEIVSVKWYECDKINNLNNLKSSRKDMFRKIQLNL